LRSHPLGYGPASHDKIALGVRPTVVHEPQKRGLSLRFAGFDITLVQSENFTSRSISRRDGNPQHPESSEAYQAHKSALLALPWSTTDQAIAVICSSVEYHPPAGRN
jgi:hypothetical protein